MTIQRYNCRLESLATTPRLIVTRDQREQAVAISSPEMATLINAAFTEVGDPEGGFDVLVNSETTSIYLLQTGKAPSRNSEPQEDLSEMREALIELTEFGVPEEIAAQA